jgi:FAD synthetase
MTKQKTIMCFGTFDLLHLGHLSYLQQAKEKAEHLTVVIALDKTKSNQKKNPIFNQHERLKLISSLEIVDKAILGNPKDHLKVIYENKPDLILLGYDHEVEIEKLKQFFSKQNYYPIILRAKPYKKESNKSTIIKNKILSIK